jgi:hypothetical protein
LPGKLAAKLVGGPMIKANADLHDMLINQKLSIFQREALPLKEKRHINMHKVTGKC